MKLSEYAEYDGVGLSTLIRKGEVSATEVAETAITAIELFNPELNAVVMTNFENARTTALAQQSAGPISGSPFLLKDVNVFSEDMPTTFSCRFFEDAIAKPDSDIVIRWRTAGLNIVGKSNTPEFAEDYVCEPTWRGPALNPWDMLLTVGGSSGGAGSAVASGMVPIGHGTDLGGSIRIPATCCGVFGHKPTVGLNPNTPYYPEIATGFNSDHVLTRSVRDSAAALDASAGIVPGNRYHVTDGVSSYLDALSQPLDPMRIGVCLNTPLGDSVDPRPTQAVQRTAELLQDAGHHIVEYCYPQGLDNGSRTDILWFLDINYELDQRAKELGREPRHEELEAFTQYLREQVKSYSAMDFYKARIQSHQTSQILMQSMSELDLILSPALGSDPIPVGAMDSRTSAFDYDTWCQQGYRFAPFSRECNITGQPSASLPVWLPGNSFPSAVQLSGHHREDHKIFQVARYLEQTCDWQSHRPPIWVGGNE